LRIPEHLIEQTASMAEDIDQREGVAQLSSLAEVAPQQPDLFAQLATSVNAA